MFMTATTSVRRAARRAGDSNALEVLARAGFVGYGIVHFAIAWLALQLALGHSSRESDQSGAFALLQAQPLGRFLVWFIAVGMAAMCVWQIFEAISGYRGEPAKDRRNDRILSAGRAIVYGAFAWTAYRIVTGTPTSSAKQQKDVTAGLLANQGGRFLVLLGGVVVIAIGVGMIAYGVRTQFKKRLMMAKMSPATRRTTLMMGRAGYSAKGTALLIVGALLAEASVTHDAKSSTGLDGALRTLAAHSWGVVLLIVIAAGFAIHGVYCFVQARYRKV